MASDDSSGTRPAPVVLRIKLRYEDLDAMVQRFAPNVGKSGLFLPTKSVQPIGAEIKFELRLADDTPALVGLGRVKALKEPDPNNPKAAFGMAIELMRVTRESRDLILRMLERRRQMGLPEVPIPMPSDIEAARRVEVVETSVKLTAAPPGPMTGPDSGPESLMTSPRRQSGPMAIAKLAAAIAPLAAEAPRRKRMAIQEIIESASGPIVSSQVSVSGLVDDLEIDIGAVLARARTLAGGNLDAELEALLEISAVPLEISIEAASAELAQKLGGAAVNRRDRSARWAPPPAISTPVATEPPSPAQEEPAPSVVATEPAEPVAVVNAEPAEFEATHEAPAIESPTVDEEPEVAREPEDDDEGHEVDPEQIADEIHQLSEDDFEEVEHTQLGPTVDPTAFDHHAFVTEPGEVQEALAQRLDAHLAQVEAESDADDLGLNTADRPLDGAETEDRALGDLLGADPDLEAGTVVGGVAEPVAEPLAEQEVDLEEIDDFEILAEADADDADLLSSHGEKEASGETPIPEPTEPPVRPSHSDFASRLDFGDDVSFTPAPAPPPSELSDRHASEPSAAPRISAIPAPSACRSGFPLQDRC